MPLNKELQALGASFCKAARTSASYRLYALSGQAVPKPGLIRSEEPGSPIDVEIWSLEPDAFGRFVSAIPAPLGIGTIELEDGSCCKGFLVESVGLRGASDITSHGGWRSYLEARKAAL
jgi:allophanate hydrolase